jgi:hypothetical protein
MGAAVLHSVGQIHHHHHHHPQYPQTSQRQSHRDERREEVRKLQTTGNKLLTEEYKAQEISDNSVNLRGLGPVGSRLVRGAPHHALHDEESTSIL